MSMDFQKTAWFIGCLSVALVGFATASTECLLRLQEEASKCFSDFGIDMNDPQYSLTNSGQGMVFDSVISQKPESFCMKIDQTKQALNCLMTHALKCMPYQYRDFLPTGPVLGEALEKICDNREVIDLNCVQKKYMALFDCGKNKAQRILEEQGQPTMRELFCMAFKINPECQKLVLKDCGCQTVKIYTDISYENLYPKSCPALSPRPVRCSPANADAFVDDGLGGGAGTVTTIGIWSLILASLASTSSWIY